MTSALSSPADGPGLVRRAVPTGQQSEPGDLPAAVAPDFNVPPTAALEAIRGWHTDRTVIVDFDETLWLRNSTEAFLAHVQPKLLVTIVLQLLEFLRPWRFLGDDAAATHRDWLRVIAVIAVCPWSLWAWRRTAHALGPKFANCDLLDALRLDERAEVVVATFGFRRIVAPLVSAIDPRLRLAVAGGFTDGPRLRRLGKAGALEGALGAERLGRAAAVTDNASDTDLLSACASGILVHWPDARAEPAGRRPLMPLVYLERAKRPGSRYFLKVVCGQDLLVLLLAFALISPAPLAAGLGILALILSFFCVYEIGYVENDRIGAAFEDEAVVSEQAARFAADFDPRVAWFFALALGALGALLIAPGTISAGAVRTLPYALEGFVAIAALFALWALMLCVVRLVFRLFNLLAPASRPFPFLALQLSRNLGYAVLFVTSVPGALLCVSQALTRWIPYFVYRHGGRGWRTPEYVNLALIFTLLMAASAVGAGSGNDFATWQAGAILAYVWFRPLKHFRDVAAEFRWLRKVRTD